MVGSLGRPESDLKLDSGRSGSDAQSGYGTSPGADAGPSAVSDDLYEPRREPTGPNPQPASQLLVDVLAVRIDV